MGRIRTIKPEFFRSRSLAALPVEARLTFAGLWVEADDLGRGVADPRILKGSLWPLDDDVTHLHVSAHLDVLAASGHVRLYEVDDLTYFEVVNWSAHQSAAYRRGEPKYPAPQGYLTPVSHVDVQESASRTTDRAGREGKGREKETPLSRPSRDRKDVTPRNPDDFETLGSTYPRRDGMPWGKGKRLAAVTSWNRLTDDEQQQALAGARALAADVRKNGDLGLQHTSTWLNQRGWEDALGVHDPGRPPPSAICQVCRGAVGLTHDDTYCDELRAGMQVRHA